MLKFYSYNLSIVSDTAEYFKLRIRYGAAVPVKQWERDKPSAVYIWDNTVLNERGHVIPPWVEFHSELYGKQWRRGYYVEGVTPQPAPEAPQRSARPVITRRKGHAPATPPLSTQAAHWIFKEGATRAQAAARYGVTVAAIGRALKRLYHADIIPDGRRRKVP